MYKIIKQLGGGHIITSLDGQHGAIYIPDSSAAQELYNTLVLLIGAPSDLGEYITTEKAKTLAAEKGIILSNSTIREARDDGRIAGARKLTGRWEFPKAAFEKWLQGYTPRTKK